MRFGTPSRERTRLRDAAGTSRIPSTTSTRVHTRGTSSGYGPATSRHKKRNSFCRFPTFAFGTCVFLKDASRFFFPILFVCVCFICVVVLANLAYFVLSFLSSTLVSKNCLFVHHEFGCRKPHGRIYTSFFYIRGNFKNILFFLLYKKQLRMFFKQKHDSYDVRVWVKTTLRTVGRLSFYPEFR